MKRFLFLGFLPVFLILVLPLAYSRYRVQRKKHLIFLADSISKSTDRQTDEAGAGEGALPAPVLIAPEDNVQLDLTRNELLLTWQPVAKAQSYVVEVDCFHCYLGYRWSSEALGPHEITDDLRETQYKPDFSRAGMGRWRVWASDESKKWGKKSVWRYFTVLR